MRDIAGLEPGERLLVWMALSFGGSAAAATRGLGITSTRARMRGFARWREQAGAAGFPAPGPDLVIGVSDRRLLVWQPAFWWPRPKRLTGSVPFDRLADVVVHRSGLVVQMTLLFTDGAIVTLEALRGRRLRRLAATVPVGECRAGPPTTPDDPGPE